MVPHPLILTAREILGLPRQDLEREVAKVEGWIKILEKDTNVTVTVTYGTSLGSSQVRIPGLALLHEFKGYVAQLRTRL